MASLDDGGRASVAPPSHQREVVACATLAAVAPFEDLEADDIMRTARVAPAELELLESGHSPREADVPGRLVDSLDLPSGAGHRPLVRVVSDRDHERSMQIPSAP